MFQEIKTRIVLINTSHPGNIGSAARAMKTMGFSDLRSVRVGKLIEIEMSAEINAQGFADIEKMATSLLANPIIEDFKVEAL